MTLATGTHLGSYEVLAQIGAGGMGEVYQAHDSKLGRDVAIKVLPEAFANDPERLSRFQREAKMLAALNHPNIATIYGLEHSNSTHYLVMELVAGETLADRIKRDGAVPLEEALAFCRQIAEALEAAHEKGIIHRDLKPANVKVTPEGKVKVLDFGLAKAFEGDAANEDMSNSPTLSRAATMQGVILGTAAYMSPEQARGKVVDKRTDIWAFGAVLYELLTGKQAFYGEDVTDILAAVVMKEPAFEALPRNTPSSIRVLLQRCLRKDRRQRIPDAGAIRIEIEDALSAPATAPIVAPAKGIRSIGRRPLIIGTGALLLGAAMASLATWILQPAPAPRPVIRFTLSLPTGQLLSGLDIPKVAISPDGTHIAYIGVQAGSPEQLYLRAMDEPEGKPIPGTDGASAPFFSPDGQWIGFFAGALKKISITGGAAVTLCEAPLSFINSATWEANDTIIFHAGGAQGTRELFQVSAAGGAARPLGVLYSKTNKFEGIWPDTLPGAKAVLFATPSGANWATSSRVSVASLQSGERRELAGGSSPIYAASGHLLYVQAGTLTAAPFDPRKLTMAGAPVPMIESISQSVVNGAAQYAVSNTGTLIYLSGGLQGVQRKLVWVNRKGEEQALPAPPHGYRTPRISPDGRRIALGGVDADTWLYDLGRDTLTRLTFKGGTTADWTPDGKHVSFGSNGGKGNSNVYWQPSDGSGSAEALTKFGENPHNIGSWSPDGQFLSFEELNPGTGRDIWILSLSDRKARPFLNTQFNETAPEFSPDGHWLAYASDESGRYEIYVQPFPGPGGKWQVSTDGGTEPRWARNGEIFYRSGDKMMSAATTLKPSFSADKPKMLFAGAYLPTLQTMANYDVTPDGQRFMMVKTSEQDASAKQINVVLNWFEELKRRVPTGTK